MGIYHSEDQLAFVERAIFKRMGNVEYTLNRQEGICYLYKFEFDRTVRRKGWGTKLFKRFEKALPKNIHTIWICSADIGGGDPTEFWQKMGFVSKGIVGEENIMEKRVERKGKKNGSSKSSQSLQQTSIGC